jgi:peptidoglycan/xylan/chitin deacetylase (PgdA/CDA1 family)
VRPGWKVALALLAGLGALVAVLVLPPATVDVRRLVATRVPTLAPPPLTVREARVAVREHAAIDRVLRYTSTVSRGGARAPEVALTFDDGPSSFTPAIVAVLRRLHVPATFFQTGYSIAAYPQFARLELEVGLGIGDHTLTHPFLAALAPGAQQGQILGAARQIHAYGAPYPRLFRPPYESFDAATLSAAQAAHMLMVLWSVDTRDFSRPGVGRIVAAALAGAGPGAIVLLHDGGGPRAQTVAALPGIVRGLRRRHLRPVTVGRLMLDDPPPAPRAAGPKRVRAGRRIAARQPVRGHRRAAAGQPARAGRRRAGPTPGRGG